MIIIRPRDVPPNDLTAVNAVLTASNIPETAAGEPEWDAGTTYNQGDIVTVLGDVQRRYESLDDDNQGNDPTESPVDWLDLGATNRWRMFDGGTGTISRNDDSIEITLEPDGFINSIAFFNLDANFVRIEMEQDAQNVYDESITFPLVTSAPNWYSYFFQTFGEQFRDTIALNLPPVPNPVVKITMAREGLSAGCGLILIGRQQTIGTTIYGSSVSIRDFSIKETDDFGNPIVVERAFVKRAELDIKLNTDDVSRVQRVLAERRAIPTVYIGAPESCLFCPDPVHGETIVYGYYRDFDIVLEDRNNSQAAIEIEGL